MVFGQGIKTCARAVQVRLGPVTRLVCREGPEIGNLPESCSLRKNLLFCNISFSSAAGKFASGGGRNVAREGSMFDPYHKWLGIPKEHRPPTYYQLLGLAPTEKDQEVIEEAAIRQTTHLRAYQIGAHAAECTRLLNEISQARLTLLNQTKRKEYDAQLARQEAAAGAKQAAQVTARQPASIAADPFADLDMETSAGPLSSRHLGGKSGILVDVSRRRKRGQRDLVRGLMVGAAAGLVLVLVWWFMFSRPS